MIEGLDILLRLPTFAEAKVVLVATALGLDVEVEDVGLLCRAAWDAAEAGNALVQG